MELCLMARSPAKSGRRRSCGSSGTPAPRSRAPRSAPTAPGSTSRRSAAADGATGVTYEVTGPFRTSTGPPPVAVRCRSRTTPTSAAGPTPTRPTAGPTCCRSSASRAPTTSSLVVPEDGPRAAQRHRDRGDAAPDRLQARSPRPASAHPGDRDQGVRQLVGATMTWNTRPAAGAVVGAITVTTRERGAPRDRRHVLGRGPPWPRAPHRVAFCGPAGPAPGRTSCVNSRRRAAVAPSWWSPPVQTDCPRPRPRTWRPRQTSWRPCRG